MVPLAVSTCVCVCLGSIGIQAYKAYSTKSSNRLATPRSSGSKLVRKVHEHHRGIAVLKAEKRDYPECNDSGRTDRTCWEQVRASPRVCRAFGRNETTLSATTQDVVEVALHASLSNILGVNQSNGSILLE
jgi:hypothetical protein